MDGELDGAGRKLKTWINIAAGGWKLHLWNWNTTVFELYLLIALVVAVVLIMRPGKSKVLESPLVINSPGKSHITLELKLKGAQSFLEMIASQFAQLQSQHQSIDLPGQYFEVRDSEVLHPQGSFYLLAAAIRGGIVYMQAILPRPLIRDEDSYLRQISRFSEEVLSLLPIVRPGTGAESESLKQAVELAAQKLKILVMPLGETQ